MPDDRLIDEASAIADRRPASTSSRSEGIRLLDRLARLFGSAPATTPDSTTDALFLWGPLEVRRRLGAGSFGEVYEAWDPTLHREVALKLRSPEVGALRWLDEARNLARIRHPNVLTVHGADVLDGRAGIWTERIVGRTLEEELETSGVFPDAEVVRIGRDIASALSAVHAAGLIHGDVKPGNVMLEEGDAPRRAVLVDFGSADRLPGADEVPAYAMGTPLTMAPEVLEGRPAAPAADVYGLGATLFRLLTRRYPVEAASIEELQRAHRSSEGPRVRAHAPQVSARLARAVERALEPDSAKRWPTAKAFGRALDDAADPTRRIRARAAAIGGGVVGVAALSLLAFLLTRPGSGPISRARLVAPRDPGAFHEAWRRAGPEGGSGWGYVTTIGDFDHDGFGDLVGAEAHWKAADGSSRGRVLVFRGGPNGPAAEPSVVIEGDAPDAAFGSQVATAGDVNADGFDDLLVFQEAQGSGQLPARVRLYLGGAWRDTPAPAWTFSVPFRDSGLGRAMAGVGDVNGDGFADVLVSQAVAEDSLRDDGIEYLFLGARNGLRPTPVWTVRGEQAGAQLCLWTRRLGDVNADGFDDLIVGAYMWDGAETDCGQARVYMGNAGGADAKPVWTFDGAGTNTHLGTMVCGAGDVNGDGYDDALVGEPQYSDEGRPERGRALLFYGGPKGPSRAPDWQALGPVAYSHFGYNIDTAGDVDGDGFADIVVSAVQYTEGKRIHLGMVEVFRGGRDGVDATPTWRAIGDAPDGHFGRVITSGDINGDHVPDLLVGAPLWSDVIRERGVLIAFLGRSRAR